MRSSGLLGTLLLITAICLVGSTTFAGGKGCLFGHCADKCTCASCCKTTCCQTSCCKVYVHVCKVPGSTAPAPESGRTRNESAQVSPYAPVLPSVPYMAAPMIQPVMYAAPQQQPRTESGGGSCNECARIDRLEEGMEEIGKRLKLIEMILKEHSGIMKELTSKQGP